MKKTAVEWLIEQLTEIHPEAFEKAKAMEKKQIIEAYRIPNEEDIYYNPLKTGEQYYIDTYEQSKQG